MGCSASRPDAKQGLALVIALLLVLAGGAADARAQALFPGQEYPTGGSASAIAVRNVNGDSTFDVIVTNYQQNTIAVLLADGTGQPGPPTTFPTGAGPSALAIGDVNGDRNLDAVVADRIGGDVSVLLGDGAGRFAPAVRFVVGRNPNAVALGDVDRDGHLDIVVANSDDNTVSVLRGDGAGRFAPGVAFGAGTQPITATIADVTGDDRPDIVVSGGGKVSLLRGDGTGGFGAVAELAAGVSPRVADVTGDGRPDIVFARAGTDDQVSVLPPDGAGGFGVPIVSTIGTMNGPQAIVDIDGDGKPDVVSGATATAGSGTMALGDGKGGFGRQTYVTGVAYVAAVGDLNGDGRVDIASLLSGGVAVRLAEGAQGLATPRAFAVDTGAGDVTVGDVNRDGRRDILTSSRDGVSVLVGDGTGGFGDAAKVADAPAQTIGDVNGDGVPDLVSLADADQGVSVRLGDGSGGFGPPIVSAPGPLDGASALGDLNGDGKPDLVFADELASRVLVLLGDGTGHFAAGVPFGTAGRTGALVIADVNGDARPDIVAANSAGPGKSYEEGGGSVAVLLGDGRGGFAPVTLSPTGRRPFGLTVGDVNGDGKPDALVANPDATGSAVSVLMGDGSGRFGAPATFPVRSIPVSVAIADLSGDGKPDLVSANSEGNDVSVLYGDGAGRFAPAVSFATGAGPSSVRVSDLNGDGRPDLVVGNSISRDVAVLLNRGAITVSGPFVTGRPPAPLPPVVPQPAKLQVFRAGIKGRYLDVLVSITSRATGTLAATYRNNGTITRFTVKIPTSGPIRISKALSTKARKGRTGILTLTYGGNDRVRADDVRLRAATGKAHLTRKEARIDTAGNLRISGTISSKARGVVRVRFTYVEPDGQTRRLYTNARITHGRWSVKRALPAAAQAAGGQASIQFTGYLKARIRGEQDAKAIAGRGR